MRNNLNIGIYCESNSIAVHIEECVNSFFFKKNICYNVVNMDDISNDESNFDIVFVNINTLMQEIHEGFTEISKKINSYIIAIADNVDEILYIEALGDNSVVVTEKESYFNNKPLKYWNSYLTERFFRIHKSYLVSIDKIERIEDSYIYMKDKNHSALQVAVRRKKELITLLRDN